MYEIPPTALTNNLATALRAVFFHISTHIRVQALGYCGYMKKQPHGCLQGCFFVVFVVRKSCHLVEWFDPINSQYFPKINLLYPITISRHCS